MAKRLRILADANIPLAVEALGALGTVRLISGSAITAEKLGGVDVLLVRSVTRVDEALLAGSSVRFVGSATTGTDHIDHAFLKRAGIGFASAPGSNAQAVVEYTLAAILSSAAAIGKGFDDLTLGVVGCGRIGGELARRAEFLGMTVLRCDPPRQAAGASSEAFVSLAELLAQSDITTLHTPLTRSGESTHPTHHLIGPEALRTIRPTATLINTARGEVVDNAALRGSLESRAIGGAVMDVWEAEPAIDVGLARLASIATPHVAGYSYDAKVEGTRMIYDALRDWIEEIGGGTAPPWNKALASDTADVRTTRLFAPPVPEGTAGVEEVRWLNVLARQAYNIRADDTRFRDAILGAQPSARVLAFQEFRRTYPVRRGWDGMTVEADIPPGLRAKVETGLGMAVTTP